MSRSSAGSASGGKNTSLRLGAAILGVVVTTALIAGATYAFQGNWKGGSGPMSAALESGNYVDLGENPKISEEEFNKLLQVHGLMQAGDYKGAKALKQELGLERGPRMGFGMKGIRSMHKGKFFNPEKREAIETALDNNDYNAWLEAVGEDCPMTEKINEDNFSRLVEVHNLRQQAREIMEELGLNTVNPEREECLNLKSLGVFRSPR